ncbi:MAG: magnesium/cobalt transporter CorA [Myxococcaceae bacterium]|nr:magnesium/cobalt transporter CorA [Myxococcaceae bacterium]
MQITVTVLDDSGQALVEGGEELAGRPGLKWIDVTGPDEPTLRRLQERFGLHRLAVEDCLHLDQRPKFEEYPNHQFLVMQAFAAAGSNICDLTLHEMHTFIGEDFVISVHEQALPAIDEARRRFWQDPAQTFARGRDFVVYALVDALVDMNFPLLDAIDDAIEALEEKIFEDVDPEQFARAFEIKRTIVTLRRVLSPQRDVIALLTRPGMAFVGERSALYFRDVYDHLIRLNEQIDSARDLIANARDAWLSAMANRTNDITKQLTIFATIFLPLTFITGFFGQNFVELQKPGYFWLMLVLCFVLPLGLIVWFRYRKWV